MIPTSFRDPGGLQQRGPTTYRFATCVLDESTRELSVNGHPVAIEPKPLAILSHLLRHAGTVVSKDQLRDAIWSGRILSESVLNKAVGKLRAALSDEDQNVIKTVHGVGYRLVADVTIGAPAEGQAPSRRPAEAHPALNPARSEKKKLTVLSARIKVPNGWASRDAEEAYSLFDPVLRTSAEVIAEYGGYVAQYHGNQVVGLFGAPHAREDHPQRALYAALRLKERISSVLREARYKHAGFSFSIGVDTGEVVVRSLGSGTLEAEMLSIGPPVVAAGRLAAAGAPLSITATESTYQLANGYLNFETKGSYGIGTEKVKIFELLGIGRLSSRIEMSKRRGLSPFLGRHNELQQLRHLYDRVNAGKGQIVGLVGEPGIGKTRLLNEFNNQLPRDCLILEGATVSYGRTDPYGPILEMLKRYFRFQPEDTVSERRERVLKKIRELDLGLEAGLPHLHALLGLQGPSSPVDQMNVGVRRQRTLDTLVRLMIAEARRQPILLVIEDLHWIDDESQAFVDALSDRLGLAGVMLIASYRPEYDPPWRGKSYFTQLRLAPLSDDSANDLLSSLIGDDPKLRSVARLIREKSDGSPFFLEELVRGLRESGILNAEKPVEDETSPTEIQLPTTLEAMIASRVDRLSPEHKEVLQTASIIGRLFEAALLADVMVVSQEVVEDWLHGLQAAEFVYEVSGEHAGRYIFKHALTRDVAVRSMLREQRKLLHERSAQAIEKNHSLKLSEHFSDLAHHYVQGGNAAKAIDFLTAAARQSLERSAIQEAIRRLRTAQKLLSELPENRTATEKELLIQTTLGPALFAAYGWSSAEVASTYARAGQLSLSLGDAHQRFAVLYGLWASQVVRGEIRESLKIGEQLLSLAAKIGDDSARVIAHRVVGNTCFHLGDLRDASQSNWEAALSLYTPAMHGALVEVAGEDSVVAALSYYSWALCLRGEGDAAAQRSEQALTIARETGHPHTLSFASVYASILLALRNKPEAALVTSTETSELVSVHGFTCLIAWCGIVRGWAMTRVGQAETGLKLLRNSLDDYRAMGGGLHLPLFFGLLADASRHAGDLGLSRAALDEAYIAIKRYGELCWLDELQRIADQCDYLEAESSR